MNKIFYLHIKKAGGTSIKKSLSPNYVRTKTNLTTFIGRPKNEWNDIINTWRIPLGDYDYKRMLFAKKYLYTEEEFSKLIKFVVVRNPYDRAVSSWKYLYGKTLHPKNILKRFSFELFLRDLPDIWKNKSNIHVAKHTIPFWGDITCNDGNLLVDKVFKLEELDSHRDFFIKNFNCESKILHLNKSRPSNNYRKFYNKKTRAMVEKLYENDIFKFGYSY